MQTLWSSYLRGDPAVTEWAEDILDEAFADAEHTALDAHHRARAAHPGTLRTVPEQAGMTACPPGPASGHEETAQGSLRRAGHGLDPRPPTPSTGWTRVRRPRARAVKRGTVRSLVPGLLPLPELPDHA